MRQLLVMTAADLRQRLRDRTVLIFGLLVPLGLMLVFNLVFGGSDDVELRPVVVAVSAPAGDAFAAVVLDAVESVDAVDVTVTRGDPVEVAARTRSGDADLGVAVPQGFTAALQAGGSTEVDITEGGEAGLETDIVVSVVDGVVARLHAASVAARAGAVAGLPADRLEGLAARAAEGPDITLVPGAAADEQLSPAGAVVAGQAGLFLLFTVGFGVLGLLAEREQGTLDRLRSMPIRPGLVVAAKALAGFVLGVLATAVLLVAGALLFDVGFGSPAGVAVLVVVAVAAATSLTFVVVRVARTAEQANVAQSILALVLGVAGGAFFPLSATGPVGVLLDLNPVAALIRGLGITAGGGGLTDLAGPVTTLLGFALVATLLSGLVPDRGAAR
ncbi:MAG: hypothetical protein AVDCRST_MAG34-1530 [uncultured Nocardioidaceae bacterium]|uniref:ABC-2 type transporter transmembrane domain-containing protein n=1 Tax=uncultured Nocardioidaceae bacterium TaxID=253824 RepID=A0A6J4L4H2_9ACTN|nr:MAG: hypothetical protein AVDCRST_MAG34-1530 [uncultured Nocardioidaceae bacterium]